MQPCSLKIVSVIDGAEKVFSREGEMELEAFSAILCYKEDGGRVCLRIKNGNVFVERTGDYELRLALREGETTEGLVGLSGMEGRVQVVARKIGFSIGKNSLLLSMKYALRFDCGMQETSLRLIARSGRNPEES